MKLSICKNVKLSREYTNHSIRATVISTLDNAGFEARHIMQLSSHKSESTIKEYTKKCPENKRKQMFDSLSEAMDANPKRSKSTPSSTVSVPQPCIQDVKQNLPNFNLEPLDEFETIDDNILAELMVNFGKDEENVNKNENVNPNTMVPVTTTPTIAVQKDPPRQQINTQFNTFHQNQMLRVPTMYFPNSHVTINYNFP